MRRVEDKAQFVSQSFWCDMKPGHLIRAQYAYKPESPAPNSSLLTCESGDQFILIKSTETEDWLYVINASGHLGYIPANFVSVQNVSLDEHLK